MIDEVPADWLLIEAAKRGGWAYHDVDNLRAVWHNPPLYLGGNLFRALCDMIERYEQPPVDRKLLCAREAMGQWGALLASGDEDWEWVAILAIELWEEGFGRD